MPAPSLAPLSSPAPMRLGATRPRAWHEAIDWHADWLPIGPQLTWLCIILEWTRRWEPIPERYQAGLASRSTAEWREGLADNIACAISQPRALRTALVVILGGHPPPRQRDLEALIVPVAHFREWLRISFAFFEMGGARTREVLRTVDFAFQEEENVTADRFLPSLAVALHAILAQVRPEFERVGP